MSIGGKVREAKEFSKKIGVFAAQVVAINPDREQLETLLSTSLDKEQEYLGEKDGVDTVRLAFYLKENTSGDIYSVSFFLEKRIKETKEDATVPKFQWVNSRCSTTWLEKEKGEEDLPSWFVKNAEIRKAIVGEEELYNFLGAWLQIQWTDPEATVVLTTEKFFKGNFSDLQELIGSTYTMVTPDKGSPYPATVLCLATIKTREVEGEAREFQSVNNRNFLPGWTLKQFQNHHYTPEDAVRIQALMKDKKKVKNYERFVAGVLDSEYGVKDFFGGVLAPLRDYTSGENLAATNTVVSEDDASY